MSYLGDFELGATFDFKFTTVNTSGVPTTLAGTPVIEVYEDNSITQITVGETLTTDFDGITGLNNVRIVASSGNGYQAGSNYQAVIATGTVDGNSVVGYVVAQWSIEDRSALRPTTAGRTLDVTATGAAGIDWGNVENPTTAVDLSATDIQLVDTCTTNTDMLTAAAVNAEVDTALADIDLDHFIQVTAGVEEPTDGSYLDQIMHAGAGQTFDATTDSLEAIRDTAPLGTAMRGTDNAALASVNTEARLAELDAANLPSDIDAILADTGTDGVVVAAASKTGYRLSATGVDDVYEESRSGHTTQGTYGEAFAGIVSGAAVAGTLSPTQMTTDLTEATDDHYNGSLLVFIGGVLDGQRTDVTDYGGASKILTFTAITEAPAVGQKFELY